MDSLASRLAAAVPETLAPLQTEGKESFRRHVKSALVRRDPVTEPLSRGSEPPAWP